MHVFARPQLRKTPSNMILSQLPVLSALVSLATAQYGPSHIPLGDSAGTTLRTDNGSYGAAVEEVHYYYVGGNSEPTGRKLRDC